ncbi:Transcription factor FAMA like [Actinidia chinensis var. chinensis]|uniref:Transcription factor FAMA like n=1 Tax=Actinidia chinensis var. chinensis TaxID=1590841 RepID=A0A2R6R8X2_ACTCC|nr:Transcription factor FAMA like [Actinidia chinensis var. chinensis]
MDKEENFSGNFPVLDYNSIDHHHQLMKPRIGESSGENSNQIGDYTLHNPDKLMSFADVMQFADFGPKLGLNPNKISEEDEDEAGIDPVYFLRFPVLNDKLEGGETLIVPRDEERENEEGGDGGGGSEYDATVKLGIVGENMLQKNAGMEAKSKRKRARTTKTSEEVESQRMTHIAVERNRRKQMNEHLRVLRSLMPGSYVQRGDQASIIGGAIEFVRELEQLLQCLESQKRRRLYGDPPPPPRPVVAGDSSSLAIQPPPLPPFFSPVPIPNDQLRVLDFETGLREEMAESKSCLADVEVKMLGIDAMIKILSRRRPGQLIKAIAALEDLQLNILHTNITTIEQTVLYSFNVKVASELRFTAEDIATSVQQIFSFIHANTTM